MTRQSNRAFPTEFVYQLFALLISFILVHAVYVAAIRPAATAFLARQAAIMQTNPDYVAAQSLFVVLKDYEQESCFVLMLWALAILAYKGLSVYRQQRQLDDDLIAHDGTVLLPEDAPKAISRLNGIDDPRQQRYLLPRALLAALERFVVTRQVQDAANTVANVCETEAERMESELSIIRYIAWAIPSIGFIGTVRGIGNALGQAHRAVEGDITGVTESLGTAFNSTFVALVISIVLMFIIHQVQLMQERLVLDTGTYCDDRLVRYLRSD
jgi:biopolymer transport protein ExbB/TolQ